MPLTCRIGAARTLCRRSQNAKLSIPRKTVHRSSRCTVNVKSSTSDNSDATTTPGSKLYTKFEAACAAAASALFAASVAAVLTLSPAAPATADVTIRFPASANPEVFAAQKTLVEAWSLLGQSFVDDEFNGHPWEQQLAQYMSSVVHASDGEQAYSHLKQMVADLGDPYTRLIPPEEYEQFVVTADGELQGVGMLIAADPDSGHLICLSPIRGGPADKAGILPGDVLMSINGQSTQGLDRDGAAKLLRGKGGTQVTVKLTRRTDQVPGVAGVPEQPPKVQYKEVRIKRGKVVISPVISTLLNHDGRRVGYIRLANFSNNAPEDVASAIADLKKQGAMGFILDLRHNPGGLVKSGIDIARLFLNGSPTIFNVAARNGLPDAKIVLTNSHALTTDPLTVLVDEDSASASEILAGALHDNHRATIVGDSHTYGKGKIQSVYRLKDGSGLSVTVAKYQTPLKADIDQIGITPDRRCDVAPTVSEEEQFMQFLLGEWTMANQLHTDSCVLTAEQMLTGPM